MPPVAVRRARKRPKHRRTPRPGPIGEAGAHRLLWRAGFGPRLGDVDALTALLTDDATFAMPPLATWYRGRATIAAFLAGGPMEGGRRWPTVPVRANGHLAFAHYRLDDRGEATAYSVAVVTLRGARIEAITAFLFPELVARFAPSG